MGEISKNLRKSMQGLQRQTEETSIQENKKLDEKVSIRNHND